MKHFIAIAFALLSGSILFLSHGLPAEGATLKNGNSLLRLTVLFNNVPGRADLEAAWGFSCLIEGFEGAILFDTGGSGEILLSNMRRLGLGQVNIHTVVLSHIHGDHTGGLWTFLNHDPEVTVYVPDSFPESFLEKAESLGAVPVPVSGPRKLMDGVHLTGRMGFAVKEQALILESREGLVVVTGCAHPNVADMAQRAADLFDKNIYLLIGGFHLGGAGDEKVERIIARLKGMGVKKVAPSHCTGDRAIRMFRKAWGDDFLDGGLGAVIEIKK